jgi:hypothetical protein
VSDVGCCGIKWDKWDTSLWLLVSADVTGHDVPSGKVMCTILLQWWWHDIAATHGDLVQAMLDQSWKQAKSYLGAALSWWALFICKVCWQLFASTFWGCELPNSVIWLPSICMKTNLLSTHWPLLWYCYYWHSTQDHIQPTDFIVVYWRCHGRGLLAKHQTGNHIPPQCCTVVGAHCTDAPLHHIGLWLCYASKKMAISKHFVNEMLLRLFVTNNLFQSNKFAKKKFVQLITNNGMSYHMVMERPFLEGACKKFITHMFGWFNRSEEPNKLICRATHCQSTNNHPQQFEDTQFDRASNPLKTQPHDMAKSETLLWRNTRIWWLPLSVYCMGKLLTLVHTYDVIIAPPHTKINLPWVMTEERHPWRRYPQPSRIWMFRRQQKAEGQSLKETFCLLWVEQNVHEKVFQYQHTGGLGWRAWKTPPKMAYYPSNTFAPIQFLCKTFSTIVRDSHFGGLQNIYLT